MPAYAGARVFRDAMLKLSGTDYTNQAWEISMEGDTPIQQQRTLVPDGGISDVDTALYKISLEGLQDWETTGLAKFLWTNRGAQVAFVFAPRKGSGLAQFSGTLIAVAPPAGGKQGEFLQIQLELPIIGEPTLGTQP
jgi:hypothetical protein